MRPYPLPLRQQVVRAVQAGAPKAAVARQYRIALSTVKLYVRQDALTGDLTPRTSPGRPPHIRPTDDPDLAAQLATFPTATLAEHCAQWEQSGHEAVSIWTMARAITRLGYIRAQRPASPPP